MIRNPVIRLSLVLLAIFLSGEAAEARRAHSQIAGPVAAEVIKVIDGDTVLVEAATWPGQFVRVAVRVRGIDAPELKARCASERAAADRARRQLERLAGARVLLFNISGDKYFGRVLADMVSPAGVEIAAELAAQGFVSAYRGGKRAPLIC